MFLRVLLHPMSSRVKTKTNPQIFLKIFHEKEKTCFQPLPVDHRITNYIGASCHFSHSMWNFLISINFRVNNPDGLMSGYRCIYQYIFITLMSGYRCIYQYILHNYIICCFENNPSFISITEKSLM